MMSLFSSFDLKYLFKFMSPFVFFLFFLSMVPICINFFLSVTKSLFLYLDSYFKSLSVDFHKSVDFFLFALFILIFVLNFFSIFPYNFGFTAQVSVVFMLGFGLWLSSMIFNIFLNFKKFFKHLVPEGCPLGLAWFIFILELVSCLIRPLTLTIRLFANILAGHLLLILLSKLVFLNSFFLISYVGLNLVELFVSIIQSYIFIVMVKLYLSE